MITEYFKIEAFRSNSVNFFKGDFRLNAEYYSHDNAFTLPDDINKEKLSEIANVIGFGPFKRYYIDDIKYGVPLISSSEMMEINPLCEGIISTELTKNFKKYLVKKNTILVSCSGTIGNITLVDSRLADKAVSQHALRVIPKIKEHIGLIYTFLNSEYGQSIITGKKSGAVIDEIYEDDLNFIDVPIVEASFIEKLNTLILEAFSKRDVANLCLEKAQRLVVTYNNLPSLSEAEIQTLDTSGQAQIRLASSIEFTHDYRLDAHFYSNIFKNANEAIVKYSKQYRKLSDLTYDIFMGGRFTRNLVDRDNGVPFIGTKNTLQIRPNGFKYLSIAETKNLKELILKQNWILLARSGSLGGTFGKVSFVWKNFENYAGSEHIIRVCSDNQRIDPAYLFAYLSSPYGYLGITQLRHGALIDEIDPGDLGNIHIPIVKEDQQKEIGDLVRQAYDLRAEAISLEDEAQELLTQALTKGAKAA